MMKLIPALAALFMLAMPAMAQDTQTEETDSQVEDQATEDTTEEATDEAEAPDAEAEPASEVSAETVVATVDGTEITLGEVIIARAQLGSQYDQLSVEDLFNGVIDQLVQQQLLADSLTEVPTRVDLALVNEERSLKAGEIINSLMATAITDEAVQEIYDAMFDGDEPTQEFNASHILVETEEEAQALIEELENGADFGMLARDNSTGPSGPNGGQLGWFGPGRMVPEFEAAVLELEVGEISAPVQTDFGWHVITLNEVRDQARPTLEELRPQIVAQLQEEAIVARLDELGEVADIELPDDGEFDPALVNSLDLLEN